MKSPTAVMILTTQSHTICKPLGLLAAQLHNSPAIFVSSPRNLRYPATNSYKLVLNILKAVSKPMYGRMYASIKILGQRPQNQYFANISSLLVFCYFHTLLKLQRISFPKTFVYTILLYIEQFLRQKAESARLKNYYLRSTGSPSQKHAIQGVLQVVRNIPEIGSGQSK